MRIINCKLIVIACNCLITCYLLLIIDNIVIFNSSMISKSCSKLARKGGTETEKMNTFLQNVKVRKGVLVVVRLCKVVLRWSNNFLKNVSWGALHFYTQYHICIDITWDMLRWILKVTKGRFFVMTRKIRYGIINEPFEYLLRITSWTIIDASVIIIIIIHRHTLIEETITLFVFNKTTFQTDVPETP